jgi:hypothetical protein
MPRPNSQKKRLYVKLTQEEKGYFSNLFQLVDSQNIGKLKAKEAANFMKKSGLSKDTLKSIYLIASQSSKQFLERDEFYVALRLIALAQNNMPYNSQAIILNSPLPPLPNFNLKKDFLSDDDSVFEMRDDEKVKYKRFFDINKDGNNDNISARKAIQMWRSTGANDNLIKRIADILRPNETKGYLNLREFQVATHLINLSDKHEIPTQLPNNLRKYLGRPEINNNMNLNFNNNNTNSMNNNMNNNNNNIMHNNRLDNIMNFEFGNSINNNMNNCQQIAISYPNAFANNNPMANNYNNRFNSMANNNNNNINNNNFNNINNSNPNDLQGTMKEIEELNQKNEIINNQIMIARNKINNILKEIDILQNEQQNITNQINIMKERCSHLMSNIDNKSNNNNLNNNQNNNNNNNYNNIMNNYNSNNTNTNTKNYNNISLNQSGIGPNKNIIGLNLPQNQNENNAKKEEYEKLSKQRQNLLDLMNKMQFDKIMIDNNNNNNNNNDNPKEDIKNDNHKDMMEPESEKGNNDNDNKPISHEHDTEKKNKFDDRLLDSQAFEPEKIQRIAMDEIPGPDDFNFGQDDVVNPYETNNNNNNDDKKKEDLNFGVNSPIGDNHFNFDRQSNLSLGSEIKKIDEDNPYPNFNGNSSNKNNDKLKINDSNAFNFEYKDEKQNIKRESKEIDAFNFNTADNQKDGDEWDF